MTQSNKDKALFIKDLEKVLEEHGAHKSSKTENDILAVYLFHCLVGFNLATIARDVLDELSMREATCAQVSEK